MARAGASKSLDKPAPKARGADQGRQVKPPSASQAAAQAPVKAAAKTVGKKTDPAVVPRKPAAKATKPAPKAAAKAMKAPAAKAVKAAPAKAVKAVKARAAPAAEISPTKRHAEVAQVAEPKGKRAGAATKAPAKTAPAAAAAKSETSAGFPAKTLDKLRRLLEEERETYVRQARDLAAEAEALAAEREPGDTQFDEESGEGDTLNVERERDLALSAAATQAVEDIDRALHRMDVGTYGVCERCGKKIAVARLEAVPFAALCVECKSRQERRR